MRAVGVGKARFVQQLVQAHHLLLAQLARRHYRCRAAPHLVDEPPCTSCGSMGYATIALKAEAAHAATGDPPDPARLNSVPEKGAGRGVRGHEKNARAASQAGSPPARSREMLVNSVARNFCKLLHLVVTIRRLTSSMSTDAG